MTKKETEAGIRCEVCEWEKATKAAMEAFPPDEQKAIREHDHGGSSFIAGLAVFRLAAENGLPILFCKAHEAIATAAHARLKSKLVAQLREVQEPAREAARAADAAKPATERAN